MLCWPFGTRKYDLLVVYQSLRSIFSNANNNEEEKTVLKRQLKKVEEKKKKDDDGIIKIVPGREGME